MTEKTLTTENIKPALDALRGELAPWPVVAKKQDRLNTAQLNAANSGITSSLVAQIIANTAAIRALESAITGTGLRALVVSSLPAIGTQGILYIVPVTTYDPDTDADVVNYSNEYLWIVAPDAPVTEGYYEQVGQTGIVINNGQLTITVNGTSVGTFTANQSGDTTAAITVPTNADYVDRTTDQTVAGVKTFSSTINGTASKAIADEDGTSIKTGYGKLAGANTWSGENQWGTNLLTVKDSAFTKGTTVTDRKQNLCKFTDSNDSVFGIWEAIQYTSGKQGIRLNLTNKYKNGALDPTGNDVPVYFEFLQKESDGQTVLKWANGLIDNGIYPVGSYSLGNAYFQWSSVYAQSYFYNGTAWGLDKANTWTGANSFSVLSLYSNSVAYNQAPSSDVELPSIRIMGGGRYCGAFDYVWRSTGENVIRLSLGSYKSDGTFGYWACNFGIPRDFNNGGAFGTPSFYPNGDGYYNLGTSTNKWKSFNGVNPGALSLPSATYTGSNAIVEIDRTGWVYDGTANSYSPPVDCWLSISNGGSITVWGVNTAFGMKTTDNIAIPLRMGETYNVSLTRTPDFCRIYPCLGNV